MSAAGLRVTEAQRKKFAATSTDVVPPTLVELSESAVLEAMDHLADAVRSIDPDVWEHMWGGKRITQSTLATLI